MPVCSPYRAALSCVRRRLVRLRLRRRLLLRLHLLAQNRNRLLVHLLLFLGARRRRRLARLLRRQHVLVHRLIVRQRQRVAHQVHLHRSARALVAPEIVMKQPAQQAIKHQRRHQQRRAAQTNPSPAPQSAPASVPVPGARRPQEHCSCSRLPCSRQPGPDKSVGARSRPRAPGESSSSRPAALIPARRRALRLQRLRHDRNIRNPRLLHRVHHAGKGPERHRLVRPQINHLVRSDPFPPVAASAPDREY